MLSTFKRDGIMFPISFNKYIQQKVMKINNVLRYMNRRAVERIGKNFTFPKLLVNDVCPSLTTSLLYFLGHNFWLIISFYVLKS